MYFSGIHDLSTTVLIARTNGKSYWILQRCWEKFTLLFLSEAQKIVFLTLSGDSLMFPCLNKASKTPFIHQLAAKWGIKHPPNLFRGKRCIFSLNFQLENCRNGWNNEQSVHFPAPALLPSPCPWVNWFSLLHPWLHQGFTNFRGSLKQKTFLPFF